MVGGTFTGLLAGLFYAFEVAVVPALRSIKGAQRIAAMQAINVKIKNPVFFLSFFGPSILLPLAAYLHRDGLLFPLKEFQGPGTPWMRFHTMRTLAATAATALIFIVCLSKSLSE